MFVLVTVSQVECKPFEKLLGNFRSSRHLSDANSSSTRSKDRTSKSINRSTTILPIIYPILVTPNSMQQLTTSIKSTPSNQPIDANSPITNLIKLIMKDNLNLNQLGSTNQPISQQESVNRITQQTNQLNSLNQGSPQMNQPITTHHQLNQLNQMNQQAILNHLNQFNNVNQLSQPNQQMYQQMYQQVNQPNQPNQQMYQLNQPNQQMYQQVNEQNDQLNQFFPHYLSNEQIAQLVDHFNKSNVLRPIINDGLLFNQSQLNLRNDLNYNFDYDTFFGRLGLRPELNYLDQFFRDDQIENPAKTNLIRNETPYRIETANSLKNEFQYANETRYPIFYRDNQYYTPKVYSTYLFPVYTP